ncbi:MAG: GDP-L-fucose synthase [Desulforegulaceae bacterium]|nr:GDP-L-fucose synthase [Desulforegulaceae bacterium]
MELNSKIFVAGHRGLVGSAIVRKLKKTGFNNLIFKTSSEADLRNPGKVKKLFEEEKPEYVFLAAAKVGGILANNTYPAEFIYDNLMIQNNVIHSSYLNNVKKLVFLGSSCIYPKLAPQPMKEEYLMTGELEPTNSPYAVAKIAGIEMCWSYNRQYRTKFIPIMPTNLYGPNDNFNLETSHVMPALIRKFHEAKTNKDKKVIMWGTGSPKREFLHVDDLADASIFIMNKDFYDTVSVLPDTQKPLFNIGTGKEITIRELAEMIKDITGFKGEIVNDETKPDGTPRKLLDVSRMETLGWKASVSLREGIESSYKWFLEKY